MYNIIYNIDITTYVKDKEDIHLHGHVSVDKQGAKIIGQGLNNVGTQIGLGASITGVGMAVAKGLVKSGMPPIQKAGVIVASSVIGGVTHSTISNMNRVRVLNESNSHNTNINSNIPKLIDDNITSDPLTNLLLNIDIISFTCISLLIILSIQIIFKFFIKDSINLNFSSVLGNNLNKRLEFYINKIILLNKKMSSIYILIILLLLLFSMGLICYICSDIYSNLDMYISVHNSLINK